MIFHGPILNQVGTKPLYKAKNPSFLKVYKKNKICMILLKRTKHVHNILNHIPVQSNLCYHYKYEVVTCHLQ